MLKGGDVNVWIADSNGGNLRQLTTGNADQSATFSADGRFVYYQHWSEGTVHLYRVPFSGGPPVQVSDLQMKDPSVLHGGDRVLVRYDDEKSFPMDGGHYVSRRRPASADSRQRRNYFRKRSQRVCGGLGAVNIVVG